MSAESFLSSAVEAAVGMAGFAGIVAAIRSRDLATWSPELQILLRMLLVASAMSTTFALLPAVLTEAGLPEPTVWRAGSVCLFAFQAGITVYRGRQLRATGTPSPIPPLIFVWVAVILALQIANFALATAWPYLLGVYGILLNAFTFFMILLLSRPEQIDPAA